MLCTRADEDAAWRRASRPLANDDVAERLVDRGEGVGAEHDAGGGGVGVHLLGRLAPTIAEATFGSRSTQASASWAIVRPACSATGRRRWTASSTGGCTRRSMKPLMLSLAARESDGGGSPGRYLPVSTPCAER